MRAIIAITGLGLCFVLPACKGDKKSDETAKSDSIDDPCENAVTLMASKFGKLPPEKRKKAIEDCNNGRTPFDAFAKACGAKHGSVEPFLTCLKKESAKRSYDRTKANIDDFKKEAAKHPLFKEWLDKQLKDLETALEKNKDDSGALSDLFDKVERTRKSLASKADEAESKASQKDGAGDDKKGATESEKGP